MKMMPLANIEDQVVDRPAIGLFAELGRATVLALQNLHQTRDLLPPRRLSGQVELVSAQATALGF
jgi:hypothetical protein